jgi:phage gp29-like protein
VGSALVLYDNLGNEIRFEKSPPPVHQAEVGRVRDHWAGKTTGEITPELASRVLRGDADLSTQMMVVKRLLKDPFIFSCMRNLVYSVSRLPWTVQPFDEKSPASKKEAEEMKSFFAGLPWLKKLFRYLIFGEFYPFSAAGLRWNKDYLLEAYIRINPVRWRWDDATSSLRLLTERDPARGEPINRRAYIIYEAELEPGGPRDRGLWQKALWLWIFYNCTWAWWVRFAEMYGNPYIWAFFSSAEEKDSVYEAVIAMDANARGVFPAGTDIKLQEAQRYGTSALYSAIIDAAHDGIAQLILGHTLNITSQPGAGTLAGNGAREVSQENKEGVAENLRETTQQDIAVPYSEWHFGEQAVERGEIPVVSIDASLPEDKEKKSTVYINVNEVLASVNRAIDPAQVEDEFEVRTVERVAPQAAPPNNDAPPDDASGKIRKQQTRVAAASTPRIASVDDVGAVQLQMLSKAVEKFSEKIEAMVDAAATPKEAADAIIEGYGALQTVALASGLRDSTLTAELMGRGDASE